jgi:hypothetical protein
VLGGGVVLRHRAITSLGCVVSRRRRDIAVVGVRISLRGGVQTHARAVLARKRAVVALGGRPLVLAHVPRKRAISLLDRRARLLHRTFARCRTGHVSASPRLDDEARRSPRPSKLTGAP